MFWKRLSRITITSKHNDVSQHTACKQSRCDLSCWQHLEATWSAAGAFTSWSPAQFPQVRALSSLTVSYRYEHKCAAIHVLQTLLCVFSKLQSSRLRLSKTKQKTLKRTVWFTCWQNSYVDKELYKPFIFVLIFITNAVRVCSVKFSKILQAVETGNGVISGIYIRVLK